MIARQIKELIVLLEKKNIEFDKGLSESELNRIEEVFGVNFPEDLKAFLQVNLPVSNGFVHWRYGLNSEKGRREIEQRLEWPLVGMLYDIKDGNFWPVDWGDKPMEYSKQKDIVTAQVEKSPKLIPIYSHRYMPSEPKAMGNPIFSVYQTDIIYYGLDLADYLSKEFRIDLTKKFGKIENPKDIKFWSEMAERNGSE